MKQNMEWTEVKKVVRFVCNRINICFFLFENMKLGIYWRVYRNICRRECNLFGCSLVSENNNFQSCLGQNDIRFGGRLATGALVPRFKKAEFESNLTSTKCELAWDQQESCQNVLQLSMQWRWNVFFGEIIPHRNLFHFTFWSSNRNKLIGNPW